MTPTAVEGAGGAVGERVKLAKGHYVMLRDQVKDLVDDELLRTPSVTDATGGAISETQARERGRMVKVADQVAELAAENGLQVSESIKNSLLPTPTTMDSKATNNPKIAQKFLDADRQTCLTYEVVLMPTPAVGHIRNYDEPIEDYLARRQKMIDGVYKGMPGVSLGVAVRMEMLPTVTVQDGKNTAGKSQFKRNTLPLNAEVTLLPTPDAYAAVRGGSSTPEYKKARGSMVTLSDQTEKGTNWGKFAPAIERWESLTRIAPSPTKPDGKDGNHRLSAEFTEWMMGLPEGWVTAEDIGLKRNDQLKACGNGVVPQQAELALRMLLQGLQIQSGGKIAMLPTPTVSDTYTDNLKSSQQKEGSMHSVTLPQAIRQIR